MAGGGQIPGPLPPPTAFHLSAPSERWLMAPSDPPSFSLTSTSTHRSEPDTVSIQRERDFDDSLQFSALKDVNFTQAQCHTCDLQGGAVHQIINPPVAHQLFYRAETFSLSRMM